MLVAGCTARCSCEPAVLDHAFTWPLSAAATSDVKRPWPRAKLVSSSNIGCKQSIGGSI